MKISIITINLNNKEGLETTIKSVINQTFFNEIEYIIIDGGSTDGSKELLEFYQQYLSYWCSEKDNGIYNAMNKGVTFAHGEYCLFLNSGDFLHSNDVIEKVFNQLDTDIVYGSCQVHNSNNFFLIKDDYLLNKGLPHPSCFIKTNLLRNRKYNEEYKIISDWIFFYEEIVLNKTKYKQIDLIVSDFFLGGISSNYNLVNEEKKKYLSQMKGKKIKIALCCIGRMENKYAVEFINFYHNLGVDKFCIYDNNYGDEEYFEEVLQPYIDKGLVDIIDFRNKSICQLEAYQDCYDKYGNKYDWICFFDFDEYILISGQRNLKEVLSDTIFDNYNLIHINELIFGDSGNIKYENKPLVERFTVPVQPINYKKTFDFPENCHVKSIVRGGLDHVEWKATPHTPSNEMRCCNSIGQPCRSNSPFVIPYVHKNIILRHYKTKSLEEYYETKVKRGYPDGNKDFFKKNNWINEFFTENDITDEKLKFINSELLGKTKKITVVIPCFNYSKYIGETIDSLKQSTYKNWNCIIVNDGSTDNSEETILNIINGDDRFTYIKQPNKGLSATRNVGIRASNSEYILCLDPDDKISPTYIENGIKYLDENKDCTLYYGKAKMFYDDGTEKDWNLPPFDYKKLIFNNHIYSAFIYRKKDYELIGGYDEVMSGYEDWEFLIRLLSNNKKVYMTNDVVFYYRRHEGSMDSKVRNDMGKYRIYIHNKNRKIIFDTLKKVD